MIALARCASRPAARSFAARGVSLIFSLMALVALSLAAVALVRSVDGGSLVVGNIGFKQEATTSADRGSQSAMTWLKDNNTAVGLNADAPASGYYANSLEALDVTGRAKSPEAPAPDKARAIVDWDGDGCKYAPAGSYQTCIGSSAAASINGNSVRWVITRLCSLSGSPGDAGNNCATPLKGASTDAPTRGELKHGDYLRATGGAGQYYRVVVRVAGTRKTVSFTETIVYF